MPPKLIPWFAVLATAWMACAAGWCAAPAPLTTAREVLALEPEALERGPAVRLRGSVTYVKPDGFPDLVIQDESGGVFVNNATGAVMHALVPGAVVDLEGIAVRGNFSPRVDVTRLAVAGTNALPWPERATFDDLKSGRLDCRYVEAAGVVRAATVDHSLTPPRLILRVAMPAGQFYAWVLRFDGGDGRRFIDAAVAVPALVANHAFRVAQEALTNAVKHGRARQITVEVHHHGGRLALRVADNGAGFELTAAPGLGTGHFGLHGLRERAARLGGTLTIESAPGRGTTISLEVPLS